MSLIVKTTYLDGLEQAFTFDEFADFLRAMGMHKASASLFFQKEQKTLR